MCQQEDNTRAKAHLPNLPESKRSTSRIKEIPKQNVLDILLANRSSTKHGKTKLHEEDESAGINEKEGVEATADISSPLVMSYWREVDVSLSLAKMCQNNVGHLRAFIPR